MYALLVYSRVAAERSGTTLQQVTLHMTTGDELTDEVEQSRGR